tara:strand:+ start:2444 stop:2755 length:312 start_codon:yes stop_codon:yes gene_type:complete
MATTKLKGTSKKIKELKGIKPDKVTKEELSEIQKLVDNINQLTMQVGRIESQKHRVVHQLAGANDEMILMQDKMNKEYGTNDINVVDGTINYPKENGEADKKD